MHVKNDKYYKFVKMYRRILIMFENFICFMAGVIITECVYVYRLGYFKNHILSRKEKKLD